LNVPALLKVLDSLPDVLSGMGGGAPPVEKVTLCGAVVPCHSQFTAAFRAIVTAFGVKVLAGPTCTVVTAVAVVVNVTVGEVGRAAAVAVAVCGPSTPLSVRWALALPFACVVF